MKKQIFKNLFFRNKQILSILIYVVGLINISELYASATKNLPIGKINVYAQLEEEYGSLFELIGLNKKVIMGSGFATSCNTVIKNKGTFNTFITQEFGPQNTFFKSLPNPFEQSYGTTLHYHRALGLEAMPVHEHFGRVYFDENSLTFVAPQTVSLEKPSLGRFITTRDEFAIAKMIAGEQGELLSSYSNKKGTLITCIDRVKSRYDLFAYSWDEVQVTCKMNLTYSDSPLCYGELNGDLLLGTNMGHLYSFNASSGAVNSIFKSTPGISSQFYCMLSYYDSVLLGHFPSGNAYQYDGKNLRLLQEDAPGYKQYGRELQSIALSGGQIYAGIWPWSEIWSFDINSKAWAFFKRVIQKPDSKLIDSCQHPYQGWLKDGETNELGQRVFNIVPYKSWLFAASSSKSGKYYPQSQIVKPNSSGSNGTLEELDLTEYGKIDMIHTPRNFSIYLPKTDIPAHVFSFLIYPNDIEIKHNETLVGTIQHHVKKEDLLSAEIVRGHGMFGPLKGKILKVDKEIYE